MPPDDEGDVDNERAALLAELYLDPELTERARSLYLELDELAAKTDAIAGRLAPVLDALGRAEEAVGFHEAHAFLTGVDDSTTYATCRRARSLFIAWSGLGGLEARVLRLENAVAIAGGRTEDLVDERHIQGPLTEEQGR